MTVQEVQDLFEYGIIVAAVVAAQWGLLAGGLLVA